MLERMTSPKTNQLTSARGVAALAVDATVAVANMAQDLHQRIARSKQMLSETEFAIADIALACGFADQAHFSSRFGSAVGKSPNRWRKLHRIEM